MARILIGTALILMLAAIQISCASPETWQDPCTEERRQIMANEAAAERPSDDYMRAVRNKYRPLLRAFPHYQGLSYGDYRADETGELVGGYGITLKVLEQTDQSTLPESQRVPECLDGVPVRIIKVGPRKLLAEGG